MSREALEARALAAREQLSALRASREEREAAASIEADIEALERAVRDEQALAAASSEHGAIGREIIAVHTARGVVIVKRPHAATFRRFTDAGSTKTQDLDRLVRPCVVHPDRAALDALLEELPATLLALANAVCELAGMRAQEVSGKS